MMNGVKAPQEWHFVQSQMNEIFTNIRNHDRQEELHKPRQARDEMLQGRNAQVFRRQGGGQ